VRNHPADFPGGSGRQCKLKSRHFDFWHLQIIQMRDWQQGLDFTRYGGILPLCLMVDLFPDSISIISAKTLR
jgi:hypothetical protein